MKNVRAVVISAAVALFAIMLIYLYINQKEKDILALKTAIPVVVASKDINELATIDETMIRVDAIPKKFIQPGAFKEIQEVTGLISSVPIKEGEQVLDTKILYPGSKTGLAYKVSQGKRAITVPVTDISGVAKLIRPGDRVDLISSIDYGSSDREEREVKTILQDVLVLATGLNVSGGIPQAEIVDPYTGEKKMVNLKSDYRYTNITLEVDPIAAQNLVFLLSAGEGLVFLSLRNVNDRERLPLYTSTTDTVLGPQSKKGLEKQGIRTRGTPRWLEIRGTSVTPAY